MFIPNEDYQMILGVLPILCVDCLIVHDGKCLLLKRSREPAKGQYWFPGGRICKGESIHDAALRKAREEVNLNCQYEGVVSVEESIFEQKEDMSTSVHTVNICCQLSVQNMDDLKIDEAHNGYLWVNTGKAKMLDLHAAVIFPLLKCFE